MNIFRVIILLIVLVCGAFAPAMATLSPRKIAPIDVGFIEPKHTMISRDGRFIVLLSLPGEKGSNCVVFDRRTHESRYLEGSGRMEPLCFSRDERQLWVWGLSVEEKLPGLKIKPNEHSFIALYDLRRKRYLRAMSIQEEFAGVPTECHLSLNGRELIYTSEGVVSRYNTRTGRLLSQRELPHRDKPVVQTILNASGRKTLRSFINDEERIYKMQIESTRTGRVLHRLHLPFSPEVFENSYDSAPRIAPRGSQIAIFQSVTQHWIFMDARTSRVQWQMGGPLSERFDGDLTWKWSPDARLIAVSGPKGFQLREASTGRILEISTKLDSGDAVFSPDSSVLYTFKDGDIPFGMETTVWQWRLFATRRQSRADARYMRRLRKSEAQFAISPPHRNESLLLAAHNGNKQRVAMLLDMGANIETLDSRGQAPLMAVFFGASAYDDGSSDPAGTVTLLLNRGANARKQGGELLAGAIIYGEPLLKLLIAHGARINDPANKHYGTPTALHAAAHDNNLPIVKFLLEHGANAAAVSRGDSYDAGKTTLMEVVENLEPDTKTKKPPANVYAVARLLIANGAKVNAKDKNGRTALSMCPNHMFKEFLRSMGATG